MDRVWNGEFVHPEWCGSLYIIMHPFADAPVRSIGSPVAAQVADQHDPR